MPRPPARVQSRQGWRALAALNRAQRAEVLLRYARLRRDGATPIRCNGKVIFGSRALAKQAAAELGRLALGRPMGVYPCPRSKHGHYHLKTEWKD